MNEIALVAEEQDLVVGFWAQFSKRDPLTPRAVEQMVLGVSTRKYERSLESMPSSMTTRGTSKSAVSRRFVAGTTRELDKLRRADLSKLTICAVMIDGIHVGSHLVLVALGIDEAGDKHILGLREGATENTVVCKAFLGDLISRGLGGERAMLFVIDGGKGLVAGIRACDLAIIPGPREAERRRAPARVGLRDLVTINLRAVRAYLLKERFNHFYTYRSVEAARRCLRSWMPRPVRWIVPGRLRANVLQTLQARDVLRRGLEAAKERWERILDRLEARAPERGYWMGDALTVADLGLFPQLFGATTGLTPEWGARVVARPRLWAWISRVQEATRIDRESVTLAA